MHRLAPIEGLRGYLALWVLLCHTLGTTGFDTVSGPLKLISAGSLAVQCFMMISGFVIFMLIDTKKEPYRLFITRRFLRIFPVFILLFALSIPCSHLAWANFLTGRDSGWFNTQQASGFVFNYAVWKDIQFHIPLHISLLHGLIPERVLPGSATAFLGPAWSLSLEWQFYLIAPFWFCFATSKSVWKQAAAYALCLATILGSRRFLPAVGQGAALPFYLEHFLLGLVSYLLYRSLARAKIGGDTIFPIVFIFALVLYKWSDRSMGMLPFFIWACVFSLLVEPPSSLSSRFVAPIFSNPVSAWLGKISYSIYLSHPLVIEVVKWGLLKTLPRATKLQHLMMLMPLALGITVLISGALYYLIEARFIGLGKKLRSRQQVFQPAAVANA